MLAGLFKDASGGAKLLVIVFVVLIGILVFSVIGIILAIPLFGIDISHIEQAMDAGNPTNIGFMKYFQTITSIGIFVFPPFIIAWLLGKNALNYLFLNGKSSLQTYVITATTVIFALPLINFLAQWNAQLSLPESLSWLEQFMKESEANAQKITELFLKADSLSGLMLNIFIIALIPAIGEELLFRGIFQKLFIDWTKNKHLGIWLAAILFSAIHIQFYGFIPRMFLGALFGYMLLFSKNMWLPIVAHFVNNTFGVIAYYMMNKSVITINPDNLGTGETASYQAIMSMIFITILMYMIYKAGQEEAREI